ncbi:BnaCnng50320D [Brassica napus]|uniref:BnaCnng50320D protein n=1 Tax=Brassica napus TaxID=3708 RepID=A0A078JI33_BRANA|nr:BnaCnng50320D [Brassica napus]
MWQVPVIVSEEGRQSGIFSDSQRGVQNELRSPLSTVSVHQATHIKPASKKSSHINFNIQALFQISRKTPHSELIRLMQAFGSMKDEHQKFVIPAMTVLISKRRPANDKALTLHELNFLFTCCIKTSQLSNVSFFCA